MSEAPQDGLSAVQTLQTPEGHVCINVNPVHCHHVYRGIWMSKRSIDFTFVLPWNVGTRTGKVKNFFLVFLQIRRAFQCFCAKLSGMCNCYQWKAEISHKRTSTRKLRMIGMMTPAVPFRHFRLRVSFVCQSAQA